MSRRNGSRIADRIASSKRSSASSISGVMSKGAIGTSRVAGAGEVQSSASAYPREQSRASGLSPIDAGSRPVTIAGVEKVVPALVARC